MEQSLLQGGHSPREIMGPPKKLLETLFRKIGRQLNLGLWTYKINQTKSPLSLLNSKVNPLHTITWGPSLLEYKMMNKTIVK